MTTQHHLWGADGNPTALPIDLTPQPLDATPVNGRVPTLASLQWRLRSVLPVHRCDWHLVEAAVRQFAVAIRLELGDNQIQAPRLRLPASAGDGS